jgi:hypothetical protein
MPPERIATMTLKVDEESFDRIKAIAAKIGEMAKKIEERLNSATAEGKITKGDAEIIADSLNRNLDLFRDLVETSLKVS